MALGLESHAEPVTHGGGARADGSGPALVRAGGGRAAAAEGMSANTWIARVLAREIAQPRGTHNQPTHTTRNQLRGYGRS